MQGAELTALRQECGVKLGAHVTENTRSTDADGTLSVAVEPLDMPGPHGFDSIALYSLIQVQTTALGKGASG